MKRFLLIIFSFVILAISPVLANQQDTSKNIEYSTGKVLEIISEKVDKNLQESLGEKQLTQTLKVKVLKGPYKNKEYVVKNQLSGHPAYDIKLKNGDRVILEIEKFDNKTEVYIADKERSPILFLLFGLFALLILIIGGIKGLKSLMSLATTTGLILFLLIPAILNNFPIIITSVGICVLATVITIFTVAGFNKKSIAAIIGTTGGLMTAGLLSMLAIKLAPLSGITDQESIILWTGRPDLDFTGILTAAMIVAALGAIMDVGVSIASSIAECYAVNKYLTIRQLIKSGLNVGRDIIGTMSNTLVLAYIGSFLPLILLAANAPFIKLFNLNSIVAEITAALVGSIGIVCCVPITAVTAGYLLVRKK